MDVRLFGHEDVEEAVELSDAAGWNQIPSDWHRIVDVQPDGCLGAWERDRLVGTTTFVTYDRELAWIGMVLVRPSFRGRGIGTHLVRTAMDLLADREVEVVGLDATDAGRPLYVREGFREVMPIIRWTGALRTPSEETQTRTICPDDIDEIRQFDRRMTAVDRGELLDCMVRGEQSIGFSVRRSEEKGYVFVRPGRQAWQVGPLVATHETTARDLLGAAGCFLEGRTTVLDAVDGFGFPALLEESGLTPGRELTRMTMPAARRVLIGPSIVAAAGFEWG